VDSATPRLCVSEALRSILPGTRRNFNSETLRTNLLIVSTSIAFEGLCIHGNTIRQSQRYSRPFSCCPKPIQRRSSDLVRKKKGVRLYALHIQPVLQTQASNLHQRPIYGSTSPSVFFDAKYCTILFWRFAIIVSFRICKRCFVSSA
jgi:hypothetical protein